MINKIFIISLEKDINNINIKENSRLELELRHLDSSNSKSGDCKLVYFVIQF